MKNIILSLCGGTGSWEKPFKENGFETVNITLPEYNVNQFDVLKKRIMFYKKSSYLSIDISKIYGIFAAPVCTMFSFARTRAKTPRDFKEGMILVESCLKIIWEIRSQTKLKFWALENPMGFLRQFLGKPAFTFDPSDFGDLYTKKTDLWGYFNEPKKKPIKGKFKSISMITSGKQKEKRAITPKGFAEAFYKANSKL